MKEPDVVVVGAGLSGLCAAALLSSEGAGVAVIEEEQDVGGRMKGLEQEGFRLDSGLHSFHYGEEGPLGELARALSLPVEFLESVEPGYILHGKTRTAAPVHEPAKGPTAPGFGDEESHKLRSWLTVLMDAEPGEWKKKSVSDFLSEGGFSEDELVQRYASALCLSIMGMGADHTSAVELIQHLNSAGSPGFLVKAVAGGPHTLVEELSRVISSDNARFVLGAKVIEIELSDKQVTRVATTSDEFRPAALLYTGPLQSLPGLLSGDSPTASFLRGLTKLKPVSGIALEMGLSKSVSDIQGVMIDPEELLIGRFPSNLDPGLAPEGAQITSWLALVPSDDLSDNKATRSHIKRMKRLVKRQFPEMMEQVKWERLRVMPMIAGAAPLPGQPRDKRPGPAPGRFKNLFLAGDAVNAPGMLSGTAISSAMHAVRAIKKLLSE